MTAWGPEAVPERVLACDVETNGLLDEMDKIHVLVIRDLASGITRVFNDQGTNRFPIADGVRLLQTHTEQGGHIVGHNAIKFDVPAIQKIFPWFQPVDSQVWDTLVMARLVYPDLSNTDAGLLKKGILPGHLFRRQSLESWGYRLKCLKGEYKGDPLRAAELTAQAWHPNSAEDHSSHVDLWTYHEAAWKRAYSERWEKWNQEMEDYCVQDVEVTHRLWRKLLSKSPAVMALELENQVARIVARQETHGFAFNTEAAGTLYATLVKAKLEIEAKVMATFRPRYFVVGQPTTPSVSRRDQEELLGINYERPIFTGKGIHKVLTGHAFKSYDFTMGAPYQKLKLVEFNPGSRDHIAIWLKSLYKWVPTEFTTDGKPKVDETVLDGLPYPEAKVFAEYLMITKRLGQIAEGKEAWLRHEKNGRIHGQMVTNGAVTGRATHMRPNLGQVPAVYSPYGKECRALFGPSPGKVLVGIDMSGIELRCLAHYMARFDGGAYGRIVVDGDIHKANQEAAGLPTRDMAKTFIYAFLYGAGADKLGSIVGKGADEGGKLKSRFLKKTPALGELIKAVGKAAKKGHLIGLDGRLIPVRHAHAALNTLLQGAGAVLSKMWLALFDEALALNHITPSRAQQVAWVHDEIQVECDPDIADLVGRLAVESIEYTGKLFGFRVPITGEYKVGNNWASTH